MDVKQKAKLLKQHSVNFVMNIQQTQILAESIWYDTKNKKQGSDWEDVTEWDKRRMFDWLNY